MKQRRTFFFFLMLLYTWRTAWGQGLKISGKVLNDKNEPLAGVSVKAVYGVGTTTDMGGNFSLPLTPGVKYEIGFSAVGYEGQTITETNASFNGVSGVGEIEGGVNNAEGLGLYGGADDNDNSGMLKYVRIEYAGYAFLPDKELNGLTLGGVGKGTAIDYVQVSHANDDSFEWFGGKVDAKHLIAYKGLDDDFDLDNGYNGRVQFAIALRDSTVADVSQSNGFEGDNDAGGSNNIALPQTAPVFSNVTMIGPRASLTNVGNSLFRRAAHLRRNSSLSLFNSVVMGWPTGLHVDASTGTPTDANITAGRMIIANTIFAGNATPFLYTASTSSPTGWTTAELANYVNRTGGGNAVFSATAEAGFASPFHYDGTVDFNATAGSAAATGGDFSNAKLTSSFFSSTTFRGAAGVGDSWWKGWTKF